MKGEDIVRGIKGLTKAALQLDKANEDIMNTRLEICKKCEYKTKEESLSGKILFRCKKCRCFLKAKVRIKSEKCPINKW